MISAVRSINNSNGEGANLKPIKFVVDLLAAQLTFIFKLSMSLHEFLKLMQIAKVVLIFKGGDINLLGNNRQISILSNLSKGSYKILQSRLSKIWSVSFY